MGGVITRLDKATAILIITFLAPHTDTNRRTFIAKGSEFTTKAATPYGESAKWRAAQVQRTPSPPTCRHAYAPAGSPKAQAQRPQHGVGRLGHAPAVSRPARRDGQRSKLAKGTAPQRFTCLCIDKAGSICFVRLLPKGPSEAHTESCAAGAGGVTTVWRCLAPPRIYGQRLEFAEGASPRG
jgi:hypothetical protein